ncbi:Arylsulfatase precursor [Planctomycetes bacterium MalM25]|nr:Arylsulfatase precursor [Planctomycetes bacterium MalM25]
MRYASPSRKAHASSWGEIKRWRTALLAGLALSWAAVSAAALNVLVIVADDQGWGDLALHGNRALQTPHLDRLAREGASFERFYVQPVCAPTRAEFLTGRYHPSVGVSGVSEGRERLDPSATTIADHFHEAGYATAAFGKWHNGTQVPYHPLCRGFDEFYGFTSGHWGHYFDFWLDRNGRLTKGEGFLPDDLTDHALAHLESHRDRPQFVYLAYNTPHSPMQVPERWWRARDTRPDPQPGSEAGREDRLHTRAALAMVENLDWNVGRLMDGLARLGLEEETIVVYFSDNGPNGHRWNGGMRGVKGSTDEGGVRSPLFVRWPGKIEAGRVVQEPAAAIDLAPTLAGLTGRAFGKSPALDGLDLSAQLLEAAPPRLAKRTLFTHWRGQIAAREGRYVLDDKRRLYDLEKDPGQHHDLSSTETDVSRRLSESVAAWRRRVGLDTSTPSRPFTVGHPSLPTTQLPARDAVASGSVKRSNRYPNCTFFSGWGADDDRVVWGVEVLAAGEYEATVFAVAGERAVGSRLELSCDRASVQATIREPSDTAEIGPTHDRVPRKEGIVYDFRPISLGKIELKAGRQDLALRVHDVADGPGPAVWLLTLTRATPD